MKQRLKSVRDVFAATEIGKATEECREKDANCEQRLEGSWCSVRDGAVSAMEVKHP